MSRNKKAASPRSKNASSRKPAELKGRITRFLKVCGSSSLIAFSATTWVLHPQWHENFSPSSILEAVWSEVRPGPGAPLLPVSGDYARTGFQQCRHFFPGQQPPVVPARPALRELCFDAFAVLHDGNAKTPVFVAQRLTRDMLQRASGVQRSDKFYAEARLPRSERAELDDYRGSGYSRGHMAPAADMHTAEAMAQSFSLANMVPQDQTHNAGAWNRIEQDTRKFARRARGPVYIFTGPVYGERPVRIGEGKVAVPDYLFKLVHDAGSGNTWVHWQANHPDSRVGHPITYEQFVQRTGLHLLQRDGNAVRSE